METTATKYNPSDKVRELIRHNNLLLMVFSRFNIPFGFGDSTVAQMCHNNNVDVSTFLSVCNLLSFGNATPDKVSLQQLIGYLKRAHSSFIDVMLPRIRHHLIEAINYTKSNDVSFLLLKFFDDYVVEVERHMNHENDVVFSYVEGLLKGNLSENFNIASFTANHGHMATKLQELKDIFIYHYNQRDNVRLSATLFDIIMCEKDLVAHFDVENALFIPAVEILEKKLKKEQETIAIEAVQQNDDDSLPTNVLSDREKEILCEIAKGKSNKEIADDLCLSVHTVSTHRRNICSKLDIHSAAGLTIFAIIHKLVNIEDISQAKD